MNSLPNFFTIYFVYVTTSETDSLVTVNTLLHTLTRYRLVSAVALHHCAIECIFCRENKVPLVTLVTLDHLELTEARDQW